MSRSREAAPAPGQAPELYRAAKLQDLSAVRRLLASGAEVDVRNHHDRTPLFAAATRGYAEIARELLSAGADPNAFDERHDSPFLEAGAGGYVEVLSACLDHGADVRSTNRFGGTALIPACERAHLPAIRLLLSAGVDPNHVNRLGWTGLHEAIILGDGSGRYVEVVRTLLTGGANPALADGDGTPPVQLARDRGYTQMVELLEEAAVRS